MIAMAPPVTRPVWLLIDTTPLLVPEVNPPCMEKLNGLTFELPNREFTAVPCQVLWPGPPVSDVTPAIPAPKEGPIGPQSLPNTTNDSCPKPLPLTWKQPKAPCVGVETRLPLRSRSTISPQVYPLAVGGVHVA